jgi:hypothetical protein
MRTYATAVGCTLMGIALALLGSPTAQADDTSFVLAARSLHFQQNSQNLISTGRSVCYFISLNRDPGEIRDRVARYTRVDPDQARQFFALAINEYCPQFQGAISG